MKADSPAVVTCVGQTKVYQTGIIALNDLTLSIEPGMSFGLMGENGAGKSTLVKLLMGFIFPTSGQLSVFGEKAVKMNFFQGAFLEDPLTLFNAGFDAKAPRAIDFHEGDTVDESALKDLIHAAVAHNVGD